MTSLRIHTCLAGAAAVLLLAGQQARADSTLSLTFAGDTGTIVNYSLSLNGTTYSSPTGGKDSQSTVSGPYFFNTGTAQISTFCIDVTKPVGSGSQAYSVSSLSSLTGTSVANAITALYGYYYDYSSTTKSNSANWSTLSGAQSSNTTDEKAFQLALWELIYDGSTDLTSKTTSNVFSTGNFTSTDSAASEAQMMLNTVFGNINQGITDFNNGVGANSSLVALTNPSYQTQIYLQPNPPPPPVVQTPAPPAFLLAGFGLVGLVLRGRFGRKTEPVAA